MVVRGCIVKTRMTYDDPEYTKDTESEDSDDNVSDEECHIIKNNANKFKENICNSMIDPNRIVSLWV